MELATPVPLAEQTARRTVSREALRVYGSLVGVLLFGVAIRAWLVADPALGYDWDLDIFIGWTRGLYQHGLAHFFEAVDFCDYPPAMLLIFTSAGHLAAWFVGDLPPDAVLHGVLKVPACLADLAIGVLLFLEARRLLGGRAGVIATALFVLNPVTIYDSAYWGQVDSIYIAWMLAAIMCVGRSRWLLAGAATAVALLTKFQAIALVPLVLFEVYRIGRWRALGRFVPAAVAAAAAVLAPFLWHGVAGEALRRSYVHVVGQYDNLAKGAFNIWQLAESPTAGDTGIPNPLVLIAAQGAVEIPEDASWLLLLNWRRVSLALFALAVAVILSIYSLRPSPIARFGAAGLLALAFYMFPTEMHERYALPAVALLPIWAIASPGRERVFYLFCGLLLMNLSAILPPDAVSAQIGAANLLVFVALLILLALPCGKARGMEQVAPEELVVNETPPLLVPWFRRCTVAAVVGVAGLGGWVAYAAAVSPPVPNPDNAIYLSTLKPMSADQGWRELALDRAVAGGMLRMDGTVYLKGLGTHAPSRLVYDVPPGCDEFRALAGLDAAVNNGSARLRVELDGREAYASPLLRGGAEPLDIRVALNGARVLTLRAETTQDGKRGDHVDWALARFCKTGEP